jgi:hypothetical protein
MYPVDVIAGDKDVITLSHGSYYPRSSSNAGGFTTTQSVRTAVSGASHPLPKLSSLRAEN